MLTTTNRKDMGCLLWVCEFKMSIDIQFTWWFLLWVETKKFCTISSACYIFLWWILTSCTISSWGNANFYHLCLLKAFTIHRVRAESIHHNRDRSMQQKHHDAELQYIPWNMQDICCAVFCCDYIFINLCSILLILLMLETEYSGFRGQCHVCRCPGS